MQYLKMYTISDNTPVDHCYNNYKLNGCWFLSSFTNFSLGFGFRTKIFYGHLSLGTEKY